MSTLLTDTELEVWAEHTVAAMTQHGCLWPDSATVAIVPERKRNPKPRHALIKFDCPHWTRGRTASLELRADATRKWIGADRTVAELAQHLASKAPRWCVPPQGGPAWCISLREYNGWEGEGWNFWFPIEHEATVLALVKLHRPSPGHDARVTPFDPPSMAHFGSWKLTYTYSLHDHARRACVNSRVGYMAYHNWCGPHDAEVQSSAKVAPSEGHALAALLERARAEDLWRWNTDDHGGINMWKGSVSLSRRTDLGIVELAGVSLA